MKRSRLFVALLTLAAIVVLVSSIVGCESNRAKSDEANATPVIAKPETVRVEKIVPTPILFPIKEETDGKYSFAGTGYLYVQGENDGQALYLLRSNDPRQLFQDNNYQDYGLLTGNSKIAINRDGISDASKLLQDYNGRTVTLIGKAKGIKPYEGEGGIHYEEQEVTTLDLYLH